MVLSLIYGKQKYSKSSVGIVSFDTMISEEHKFSSRITYFPVESGPIVSDHIINQPVVIILSGLVTDTPLNILAQFNRSVSAFDALVAIHENRQVVDVVTGIKIYRNMAITSLDVPRTIKTGQSLTFNIQLQRIIFDDTVSRSLVNGNVFDGKIDNTPREIVAENTQIPILQNDPPFSLKDQATSASNVGIQSLSIIPDAVLPNVLINMLYIG